MSRWGAFRVPADLTDDDLALWICTAGASAASHVLGRGVGKPWSLSESVKRSGIIEPVRFVRAGCGDGKVAIVGHLHLSDWSGVAYVSWRSMDREIPVQRGTFLCFSPQDVSVAYRDPRPDGSDARIFKAFYTGPVVQEGTVSGILFGGVGDGLPGLPSEATGVGHDV